MGTSLLTPNEARRAIHVDFEGNTDSDPTLLGILYTPDPDEHTQFPAADVIEQWILERAFDGSADESGSPTGAIDLLSLALKIIAMAKREKRRIVSWSQHDFALIMKALGPRTKGKRAFAALYRDAKVTSEAWSRAWASNERPDVHALSHYLRYVEYEVPAQFGPGLTGDSLREIRASLETHKHNWQRLTTRKRDRSHAVLMHNRHDLLGMKAVVEQATASLHTRGVRDLLHLLEESGLCTKPFCTTCGSLAGKRASLSQFVAGSSLRDMLTGITTTELEGRAINAYWLVELLHQLPKTGVRVVLRAWAKAGILSSIDLTASLVARECVFRLAPRSVRSAMRDVLRQEALKHSAKWTRKILIEHFDGELAPDDPVRVYYADDVAERLAISEANAAREARLADDRNRVAAFQELAQVRQVELVCTSPEYTHYLPACIGAMSAEQAVALPRPLQYAPQRRLRNNRSVAGRRIKAVLHMRNANEIVAQRATLEGVLAALPLIDQLRAVVDSALPVGRFSTRIAESGLAVVSALPDALRNQLAIRLRLQQKGSWAKLRRAAQTCCAPES
jgi:hypothetical protein